MTSKASISGSSGVSGQTGSSWSVWASTAQTITINPSRNFALASTLVTPLFDFEAKNSMSQSYHQMIDNEIRIKKEKGLCFRCDEKFSPEHRCKRKKLNIIAV